MGVSKEEVEGIVSLRLRALCLRRDGGGDREVTKAPPLGPEKGPFITCFSSHHSLRREGSLAPSSRMSSIMMDDGLMNNG